MKRTILYRPVPVLNKTKPKQSTPQLKSVDPLMIPSSKEPIESVKCNTPESQRKNLFGIAKTTVDKVKQNVMIKRREWINMVYNPNEVDKAEDEDEVDK